MQKTIMVMALLSSTSFASEIEVDLKHLSNTSNVGNNVFSIQSTFNGFDLDNKNGNQYIDDTELNGLDWAFWYGKTARIQKSTLISEIDYFGEVKHLIDDPVNSRVFYWDDGSSTDYAHTASNALSIAGNGGFSFSVTPTHPGQYHLDLYTHNWLSSSDVTACINNQCLTIQNDIGFHMTANKNTITFRTEKPQDELTVTYSRSPRQFDWSQQSGYHALEAINLREVK